MNNTFKFPKINHLLIVIIFFLKFILPILLFGSVVIIAHDNLEVAVPHDYIIQKIYRGEFQYLDYFLAGNYKWYFIENIFYPINLLTIFFDIKIFYFVKNILNVILAYFTFYILCKKLKFSKTISSLGGALYLSIIGTQYLVGFDLAFFPYLIYLLIKNKNLKIKNYLIVIFFGLNGGLAHNLMAVLVSIPLVLCLNNKINLNFCFKILLIYISSLLITDLHMIFTIFFSDFISHRSSMLTKPDFIYNLKQSIQVPFLEITFENLRPSLMKLLLSLTMLAGILLTIIQKNKSGLLLILFVIIITLLRSIFGSDFFYYLFTDFLTPLKGLNFMRIDKIIPISMSLIVMLALKNCNKIFFKFSYILLICGGIFIQQITPILSYFLHDLEENIKMIKKNDLIISRKEKNIFEFSKIIFSRENFNENKNNSSRAKFFWDEYYHFKEYKIIKKIVGDKRVMSVGIDPLVAVMNDIKVIDGYHTLYSINYKKKFRKIIEDEIKINSWLVDYYDNWGNRVYAFYNHQNNILINFKEAKKIGASYIISGFKIDNINLQLIKKIHSESIYIHDTSWMCYLCLKSDGLYLYKII